ncbi:MAG TPA: hypothetical protein VH061_01165 [Solirubrobacteraceae bacterium]|jgi:hypothetical protein|nr:hypothetical protein [Solirubrobacteraceae bacterium]
MQTEPTSGRSEDELERDVLYRLTADGEAIWSVEDLGLAVEDETVEDAVAGLLTAGLALKTSDGFVFATHAGFRAVAIIGTHV